MKSYMSYQMTSSFNSFLKARISKQVCYLPSIFHSASQECMTLACLIPDIPLTAPPLQPLHVLFLAFWSLAFSIQTLVLCSL